MDFVLSAVITSMTPAIMKYKNEGDEENYLRKNRMLYSIIFYLSVGVSLVFTVFTIKERHRVGYLFIVAFSFVSALLCVWVGDTIVDTYHGNINVELYNLLTVNSLSFVYYILLGLSLFVYFAFSFRCLRGFEFKNSPQQTVHTVLHS